ncbi:(deoxy)nucleoside triphosphate pyrophosphohydrolase [Desulfallas thermosapovorans]|uniref:8-oxo-dGTP diphosphatase n=1 Tax=Desulfallas thermosapovorans DSM 6562 TaxID=1121431 RepID=A0A5S4ZMA1_9FIRM|nr:(deoxy)nucleoside triphosphate pyrophosphohydrolase [Desulfallas thermosapovorans]TYO91688.1 8-oxo-dGTP diphosphatase [Desulfallas thermosapovorans DSM 6562]
MKTVTAAILMKNGHVLIAKRGYDGNAAGKWEFPGGKIEAGETPEECLRREMKEEFCIDVEVKEFFGKSIYRYENVTINLLAYWTRWVSGNIFPTVHTEYRWVKPKDLVK